MGKDLADLLEKGSVVALTGPLGAGKTCFAKGIACGLGISENVTSPTYTIISEYEGRLQGEDPVPFYHIDAYRLQDSDDFSLIGGEEIVFGNGISVIEWSEHILNFIPDTAVKVEIQIESDEKRTIRINIQKPELI